MQTISSMSMSPKDSATVDATDQEKVEIQAPVAPDSAVVDNVAADTEAEDDTTKDNNKQHKMTVAADAPWSARMVRIQTSYVLFGLYFVWYLVPFFSYYTLFLTFFLFDAICSGDCLMPDFQTYKTKKKKNHHHSFLMYICLVWYYFH